jgi:hypothetical protein
MKALFSLSQINVAAGLSAAQAFSAPVSDWGFMSVAAGQPAGGYLGNFTTQSTMPVVSNTTYTVGLYARHEVGDTTDSCGGSFTVQVF